jgi:hypothetical protein
MAEYDAFVADGCWSRDSRPLTAWSNHEVQAAVDATLSPADDQRLTELLYRQQADLLTAPERSELTSLMHLYQQGWPTKAQAEAVRRGFWEPLQP